MDRTARKPKEQIPANPPGDLYFEQKQESRRTEPCRLKRPNPARTGFWRLLRRAGFSIGLMIALLFTATAVIKLSAKLRARARPGPPPASGEDATVAETIAPVGTNGPAALPAPDIELMQRSVLAARKAIEFERKGSWSNAAAAYSRSLELWPRHAEALGGLGRATLMMGDLPRAASNLNRAAAADPGNADVLNSLGRLEMLRRNPGKAGEYFKTAIALHPDHLESRLNMARSDFALGYVDRARKHVQGGLEKHPGDPGALQYLAYLEAAAQNYQAAADILAEAIEHAPDLPSLLTDAAAACALMGKNVRAIEYLRSAIALDSADSVRNIFGGPVFLSIRNTPEGRAFENELAERMGQEKEAGIPRAKEADSTSVKTAEDADTK